MGKLLARHMLNGFRVSASVRLEGWERRLGISRGRFRQVL
jgi:hypothetical protein